MFTAYFCQISASKIKHRKFAAFKDNLIFWHDGHCFWVYFMTSIKNLLCVCQKRTTLIHDDRIFLTEHLQEILISSKRLLSCTVKHLSSIFDQIHNVYWGAKSLNYQNIGKHASLSLLCIWALTVDEGKGVL